MKHTDYIELTRAFESLTKGADTLRLLFSKVEAPADPDTLEPGEPITRWVPTDQARQHPLFPHRWDLLNVAERTVEDTAELMDQCVDDWTHENQDRADNDLGPTADTRGLFQAMAGFMSATEFPTRGIAGLYDKTRSRCRAWLGQANEWFQDLNGNHEDNDQGQNQEPGPTSTGTVKIDRDKMAQLFLGGYKSKNPVTKLSPFDMFCNALDSGAVNYSRWDYGIIAYQVQQSNCVLKHYRKMPFTKFAGLFYACCGVTPPKIDGPRKFKTVTDKTDYSAYLEMPK